MLSPEELLKPRYKVIDDWPRSEFAIGEILLLGKTESHGGYWNVGDPNRYITQSECNLYPHLFRRLEWWENRNPEDMPQYLSELGKENKKYVYKFGEDFKYLTLRNFICMIRETDRPLIHWKYLEPATETEYKEYLKSIIPLSIT